MPGPVRNVADSMGEAVVNPVKDEVGAAIEAGVQSVIGTQKPLDPQQEAKKKVDEGRKRQNIIRFLNQYNTDRQRFQIQKQQEEQRKLAQDQKKQQEKMKVKQIQIVKKQNIEAVKQAQTRTEAKRGVGG